MEMLLFVSSKCTVCPRAEKIAKKLSREYKDKGLELNKVRLKTSEGKELADEYNIRATPTIVLLDEEGNENKRIVGVPDEGNLRGEIEKGLGLRKGFMQRIFGR